VASKVQTRARDARDARRAASRCRQRTVAFASREPDQGHVSAPPPSKAEAPCRGRRDREAGADAPHGDRAPVRGGGRVQLAPGDRPDRRHAGVDVPRSRGRSPLRQFDAFEQMIEATAISAVSSTGARRASPARTGCSRPDARTRRASTLAAALEDLLRHATISTTPAMFGSSSHRSAAFASSSSTTSARRRSAARSTNIVWDIEERLSFRREFINCAHRRFASPNAGARRTRSGSSTRSANELVELESGLWAVSRYRNRNPWAAGLCAPRAGTRCSSAGGSRLAGVRRDVRPPARDRLLRGGRRRGLALGARGGRQDDRRGRLRGALGDDRARHQGHRALGRRVDGLPASSRACATTRCRS
jgi:hypothetical protein